MAIEGAGDSGMMEPERKSERCSDPSENSVTGAPMPEDGTDERLSAESPATGMPMPELRWRLAGGKLPLRDRHLRSLPAYGLSAPLCAYIRTRIEWSAENDIAVHPNGVLVISRTDEDDVVISVEPARSIPEDVAAQGVIWLVHGDAVNPQGEVISAANTLTRDLLKTLGYSIEEGDVNDADVTETFIVTDEFGITPCDGEPGPVSRKLVECFNKLWSLEG